MENVTFDGEEPTEQDWENLHSSWIRTPGNWLREAIGLKIAADSFRSILINEGWPEHSMRLLKVSAAYQQPMLMLYGYSFECLIKGIILINDLNVRFTKVGHYVAKHWKEFTEATEEEVDLLDRLRMNVMWAGRYPAPNTPEEIRLVFSQMDPLHLRQSDPALIDSLFRKIADLYPLDQRELIWPFYDYLSGFRK